MKATSTTTETKITTAPATHRRIIGVLMTWPNRDSMTASSFIQSAPKNEHPKDRDMHDTSAEQVCHRVPLLETKSRQQYSPNFGPKRNSPLGRHSIHTA